MTAADRQRIRAAIDAHKRAQRHREIEDRDLLVCAGCGGDSDIYTAGCNTCNSRRLKRKRRALGLEKYTLSEEQKARKRELENARRRRLKQAGCSVTVVWDADHQPRRS